MQMPSMDVGDQPYKFVFKKKFWFNEFTETELGANEVAFNLIYCQVRTLGQPPPKLYYFRLTVTLGIASWWMTSSTRAFR